MRLQDTVAVHQSSGVADIIHGKAARTLTRVSMTVVVTEQLPKIPGQCQEWAGSA